VGQAFTLFSHRIIPADGTSIEIEYDGALYHVTSRGNERRSVFRDGRDRGYLGGKRGPESFIDRTGRVRIDAMANATASSFSNRWIGIPRFEPTCRSAIII
jgi:hypothetical protein